MVIGYPIHRVPGSTGNVPIFEVDKAHEYCYSIGTKTGREVMDMKGKRPRESGMINVRISTILTLKEILGRRETEMSVPRGSTVEALLTAMVKTWGEGLSSFLFDPKSRQLRSHIRLMVNGQDIGFLNGMETVLQEGDEVLILPPVAGG